MTPLTLRFIPPAPSMPLQEGSAALEMAGLVQAVPGVALGRPGSPLTTSCITNHLHGVSWAASRSHKGLVPMQGETPS